MLFPRVVMTPFLCSLWQQNFSQKIACAYCSSNFFLELIHLILHLHNSKKNTSIKFLPATSNISKTNGQFSVLILSGLSAQMFASLFPSSSCCCSGAKLTLWDPMDCSMPGFSVLHYLLQFAQTHVRWVNDAIQPSHLLSSPSPPAFNLSQH